MIELRWCVEKWIEYPEGSPRHKSSEPKLQYRAFLHALVNEFGDEQRVFSDWTDVPTEYIEG